MVLSRKGGGTGGLLKCMWKVPNYVIILVSGLGYLSLLPQRDLHLRDATTNTFHKAQVKYRLPHSLNRLK